MKAMKTVRGRAGERGIVLLLTVASLGVIIPMVGLTVDVGYLYASKARLQASVDGAALAAARALSLGATTAAQADSAKQNAVNWFYSNFPVGSWSTTSTTMNVNTVTVATPSPSLSTIRVVASTRVPTYFMKWLNINNTLISSTGTANRRTTVVMMALDRSFSMTLTTGACQGLKDAAKLFTGQFAAGRDYIGMLSFSDGISPIIAPTTNFRSVLGYNTGSSSGTGAIDQIGCNGGTGTAAAITAASNELVKVNLPGAYNVLVLETDGLPNSLSFNFWDSSAGAPADPNKSMFAVVSGGCQDTRGVARSSTSGGVAGWGTSTYRKDFYLPAAGSSRALGGFLGTIGPGTIGTIWSNDTITGNGDTNFDGLLSPWHHSQNMGLNPQSPGLDSSYLTSGSGNISGCKFATAGDLDDFKYLPRTDIFGNDVLPANNYSAVTLVNPNPSGTATSSNQNNTTTSGTKYLKFVDGMSNPTKWTNYHNAAANASDHAAFRARTNSTIPATVFVIGLGGNGNPDEHLMQRWANDPLCDQFNQPINQSTGCGPAYTAYTMPSSWSNQAQGTLVMSSNINDLKSAFLRISSQVLRLAH